jgi:hypothetical protein
VFLHGRLHVQEISKMIHRPTTRMTESSKGPPTGITGSTLHQKPPFCWTLRLSRPQLLQIAYDLTRDPSAQYGTIGSGAGDDSQVLGIRAVLPESQSADVESFGLNYSPTGRTNCYLKRVHNGRKPGPPQPRRPRVSRQSAYPRFPRNLPRFWPGLCISSH